MYQALYRKYRPRRFSDVCGQEHITVPLAREVANGTVSHAYLFTGSRGIGKTTCAKILAKAVNCPNSAEGEPCGVCPICVGIDDGSVLDVTEIDAASNNGVDDVRSLRAEANFTPALAKYRVYIIDEAHMLSNAAANALLKIMEEPPEHVIFILATTEPHRLPATILSRCMRFDFRRIPPRVIADRLLAVSSAEGIALEDDAALLIGRLADGGMRDALSLLDICRGAEGGVTVDVVTRSAGLAGRDYLFELTDAVAERDTAAVLSIVERIYSESADVGRLCDELIGHFRNLMVAGSAADAAAILKAPPEEIARLREQAKRLTPALIFYGVSVLQETLGRMARSTSKRLEFELALVRLCSPALSQSPDALLARIEKLEGEVAQLKARPAGAVSEKPISAEARPAPATIRTAAEEDIPNPKAAAAPISDCGDDPPLEQWGAVLDMLAKNPMLYANLAGSRAYVHNAYVLIDSPNTTFTKFMQTNETAKECIKAAIAAVTGRRYAIGPYKRREKDASADDPLLALAQAARDSNIELTLTE